MFVNHLSKCPDIKTKSKSISLHRVPPGRSNKVKTYFSSVGSPCITHCQISHTGQILYTDKNIYCQIYTAKYCKLSNFTHCQILYTAKFHTLLNITQSQISQLPPLLPPLPPLSQNQPPPPPHPMIPKPLLEPGSH